MCREGARAQQAALRGRFFVANGLGARILAHESWRANLEEGVVSSIKGRSVSFLFAETTSMAHDSARRKKTDEPLVLEELSLELSLPVRDLGPRTICVGDEPPGDAPASERSRRVVIIDLD